MIAKVKNCPSEKAVEANLLFQIEYLKTTFHAPNFESMGVEHELVTIGTFVASWSSVKLLQYQ